MSEENHDETLHAPFEHQPYLLIPHTAAPTQYPTEAGLDAFWATPFAATFEERRRAYFEFVHRNPAPETLAAPWFELARLASGGEPHSGVFQAAIEYLDARLDGSDALLHSMLRLIYQYDAHQRLDEDLLESAHQALLNFKYWPDEPGQDDMITWSEAHYLAYAAAGYLAGQRFPDEIFTNVGDTGAQKMGRFRPRLAAWMDLRFRTGFSEWLSQAPIDLTLAALLNLADFAKDAEIASRAGILIDLLLYDLAAHQFSGAFTASRGKAEEGAIKWVDQENTADTQKLLFGRGMFAGQCCLSAAAFALSLRYRMPQVLNDIANDQDRPELLLRQRAGIDLDNLDAFDWPEDELEKGMLLLNQEAYLHPNTAALFLEMLDTYDWHTHPALQEFAALSRRLKTARLTAMLRPMLNRYARDVQRYTRTEANLYTYRTPDYSLSSVQDYRPGFGGSYEHSWQACLGPDALCFTTHPARLQGGPPNRWQGSGCMPRLAQIKNVLFAIYRLESYPHLLIDPGLDFTHAWLPRDQFEQVEEQDGWIFARHGQGYLALLSENPYEWQSHPGEEQMREVFVPARRNIWICELGRQETSGSFKEWMERILAAEVEFDGSNLRYHSPSQGPLEFGWKTPLKREGRILRQTDYPRYASPYAHAEYPMEAIAIQHNRHSLALDWRAATRETDATIE